MPRDAESRRIVGGYMWRDAIERCIRLEQEDMPLLRHLIATSDSKDELRRYSAMLVSKVEVVTILNELLRYRSEDK